MGRAKIFVWAEKLENEINLARFGNQPRDLTHDDLSDWDHAAANPKAIPPRNKAEIIAALKRMNRYKYATYVMHRKWVRRKMAKMGLNSEDERYLM